MPPGRPTSVISRSMRASDCSTLSAGGAVRRLDAPCSRDRPAPRPPACARSARRRRPARSRPARARRVAPPATRRRPRRLAVMARQVEAHRRALRRPPNRSHLAAGLPREAVDHRQAEAGALAIGLVVKNGSNARAITSASCRCRCRSRRARHTGPACRSRSAAASLVEPLVGGLDGDAAAIRHGVARVDAEVEQRVLELVGIDQRRPQPAGRHRPPPSIAGPTVRRISSSMPATSRFDVESAWDRASGGARRRAAGGSARRRGCAAPWRRVDDSGRHRPCRPCAMRVCISSRLPMMPASRLLKSCARPPVSWPTASIFCAWRSASSVSRKPLLLAEPLGDVVDELIGADATGRRRRAAG